MQAIWAVEGRSEGDSGPGATQSATIPCTVRPCCERIARPRSSAGGGFGRPIELTLSGSHDFAIVPRCKFPPAGDVGSRARWGRAAPVPRPDERLRTVLQRGQAGGLGHRLSTRPRSPTRATPREESFARRSGTGPIRSTPWVAIIACAGCLYSLVKRTPPPRSSMVTLKIVVLPFAAVAVHVKVLPTSVGTYGGHETVTSIPRPMVMDSLILDATRAVLSEAARLATGWDVVGVVPVGLIVVGVIVVGVVLVGAVVARERRSRVLSWARAAGSACSSDRPRRSARWSRTPRCALVRVVVGRVALAPEVAPVVVVE